MNHQMVSGMIHIFDNFLIMTNHPTSFASDTELDEMLETVIKSNPWVKLSDEEVEAVRRDLQYRYKVKITPGESIQKDYSERKWYTEVREAGTLDTRSWDRYADYLVNKQGFPQNVVDTLGQVTLDKQIMDCLADPKGEPCMKRGLIIGDVQSGKTSTYTGLICKAADAGYKVFIILTGTIESLRIQTQQRIEEGFIGIDLTNPAEPRVGVGSDNKPIMAESLTSRKADFTGNSDKTVVSVMNHAAVVFVIKKNTSVLTKLGDWLINMNADPHTGKINAPMLLIDDEADNASINTKSNEDPTKINGLIRRLVNIFSISNYVGFTATPFANVFIDPLTKHDMFNHDLFPEDFIVALPSPSNYVGAKSIFNPEGRFSRQVTYIEDAGVREEDNFPFYYLHKIDWNDEVPDSLTDAIYTFYLANAIRDLRNDRDKHRSMLINMSRFTKVQYRIRDKVEAIDNAARRAIQFNLLTDTEQSLQDPILNRIHEMWEKHYSDLEFNWEDIAEILWKAVEPIEIRVVNSSRNSDKLVYPKDEAIRVIAIGGLALSRGLTLEGLIVSYFYRNTCTYDVLMQMGRWFGYRKNYEDIFRIWTSRSSAAWYSEIADATEQLKRDMTTMRRLELKPRQFGIRVRDDSRELRITANNKMKNAQTEYEENTYYGRSVETAYLSSSAAVQHANFRAVTKLIRRCLGSGLELKLGKYDKGAERYLMTGVPKQWICELIDQIDVTRANRHFDPKQIAQFLRSDSNELLDEWDVAFIPGAKGGNTYEVCGTPIWRVVRNNCSIDGDKLCIGQRGKLGGTRDGIVGSYNPQYVEAAEKLFKEDYSATHEGLVYEKTSFSFDTWFKYIPDRKPLLYIYLIDVEGNKNQGKEFEDFSTALGDNPVVGFAMGIPKTLLHTGLIYRYKVNSYYNPFELDDNDGDDESNE